MNKILLGSVVGLFLVGLGISWLSHGTGVLRNDAAANIYIPDELTLPLQVKAAYDGERIFFRYRWPAERPSLHHDVVRYEGGTWRRYGDSVPGPQPHGLHEDRVSMLVDDGNVPEFARYGGYVAIGDAMHFFTGEAPEEDVKKHPYLGQQKQQTEIGKYLPETRAALDDWRRVVPEHELHALREAGYFLDLLHWRAHRSNPIGMADDQYVAEARYSDQGTGPYFTNWDTGRGQPRLMFDPALNDGAAALAWADVIGSRLGLADVYYLREDRAVPFDPHHAWRDGDTIPLRVLRTASGSRGDILVHGEAQWEDGYWDVTLVRVMDTGKPLEDKIFRDKGSYVLGFAVHRDASAGRWHYVSLPLQLGLDRDAELQARRFAGEAPTWEQDWHEVTLFYPGQVSWPMLNGARHAGAHSIREGVPVRTRHSEAQLARYGVEIEFRDAIYRQWLYTMFAGLLLIAAFGVAVNLLLKRKEG
jgi:hypothetical protein